MSGLLALGLISALSATTIHLPVAHQPGQQIALHCVAPAQANGETVLFVHGASFPTMLAFGFEFAPGDSWMNFMARQRTSTRRHRAAPIPAIRRPSLLRLSRSTATTTR